MPIVLYVKRTKTKEMENPQVRDKDLEKEGATESIVLKHMGERRNNYPRKK